MLLPSQWPRGIDALGRYSPLEHSPLRSRTEERDREIGSRKRQRGVL